MSLFIKDLQRESAIQAKFIKWCENHPDASAKDRHRAFMDIRRGNEMSNYKNQMKMYLESLERNAKLIELEIEREKTSIEFAKNIIKDRSVISNKRRNKRTH